MQSDSKGAIAAIGTTLEIESHVRMDDGRLGIENTGMLPTDPSALPMEYLCESCNACLWLKVVVEEWSSCNKELVAMCIGIERFKVLRICEERPVLICEVEVLEEDDDSHPEVH